MIRYVLALVACVIALPALAEVEIDEITTPGGIDAWLVEDHTNPFVALELRFRGGEDIEHDLETDA